MSAWTMFTNALLHVFEDKTIDAEHSSATLAVMNNDDRDDTLYFETDSFLLDQNEARDLALPNFSEAEWIYITLKVNGEVEVQVLSLDFDNVSPLRSYTKAFGDSRFPGFLQISTYNVLSIVLVGVAANSSIESYASVICPPTDGRLLTN